MKLEGHPEGQPFKLKGYLQGLLLKLSRSSIGPPVEIEKGILMDPPVAIYRISLVDGFVVWRFGDLVVRRFKASKTLCLTRFPASRPSKPCVLQCFRSLRPHKPSALQGFQLIGNNNTVFGPFLVVPPTQKPKTKNQGSGGEIPVLKTGISPREPWFLVFGFWLGSWACGKPRKKAKNQ